MIVHTNMKQIAETVVILSNASATLPLAPSSGRPMSSSNPHDKAREATGTRLRDRRENTRGASFSSARP